MTHTDIIIDQDPCFEIDITTRVIKNMSTAKTMIIQHDHNSERFGFSMPRYVEGHDMSISNRIEVHYINLDTATREQQCGVYEVPDVLVDLEDEERIHFSWLLSKNATRYEGLLSFLIRFSCFEGDTEPVYIWNTSVFSGWLLRSLPTF